MLRDDIEFLSDEKQPLVIADGSLPQSHPPAPDTPASPEPHEADMAAVSKDRQDTDA